MSHPGQFGKDVPVERLRLPRAHRRVLVAVAFERVGQVVLVVRAVRGVRVDEQVRQPPVEQRQFGPRFRRVGLHPVPVQVVVLRGHAPAHFRRSVLVDPVERPEPRVPVHAHDRHDQQDGMIEQPGGLRLAVDHEVPDQREAGVLALAFAGMDAAVHEHDFLAGGPCGLRGERLVERHHKRHDVPPFRADADGFGVNERTRLRQPPCVGDGFRVGVGFAVIGPLRLGAPVLGGRGVGDRHAAHINTPHHQQKQDSSSHGRNLAALVHLPTFHLPPSAFRLPPSTFHLLPSAFRLLPLTPLFLPLVSVSSVPLW